MTQLKLALAICAVLLFAGACNTTTTINTSDAARTNPTPAAPTAPTAPATTVAAPDELAAARATYNVVCAKCHMPNGEGGTVELDEGTTLKVPSFKTGRGLTRTDEQFARQIANGGDGMPAFKSRLTPEQINDLVRFIRREFQAGLEHK
ncbi:MAG: cytochrome c [Pyrinomonadaceae bacterium]|nr:cytochrome c [Pyrinomonadaceae bacterium]